MELVQTKYAPSDESTECEDDTDVEEECQGKAKLQKMVENASSKLPRRNKPRNERRKRADLSKPLISACIARSVGSDEMKANKGALKAQKTEWGKLWDQNV